MVYQKDYTTIYKINGREYEVTAPALFDSETGEMIPNLELDDQAAEIARAQYRKDMGLISPTDLKMYRAKVGLSQRNLAELTGLSPNTIALYEAGAFPTKANNHLLKTLINNDGVLRDYMCDCSNKYSDELISKVNAYLKQEDYLVSDSSITPKYTAVQLTNWLRVENYFERDFDINVDPLTQMKAIKLLYFAYGRFLVSTRSKLFSSPIIHFQYGPLITEVHEEFKGQRVLDIDKPDEGAFEDYNLVAQDKEITELLTRVNNDYLNYSAYWLSRQTHQPGSPWSMTPEHKVIKDQLIFDAFKNGDDC
ncbi:type II toxin-antitoxin system antitoxin SocA domain-containing protein [Limosilactobacillus allomucosae]|uniref:Type II toxin-antitoxin system antitoxin SocA domain-containing protein n=1 Tax=Limosilactobacillus allomucosae TaxID=3142938 RepID=A0AAU7C4Z9_9LACO